MHGLDDRFNQTLQNMRKRPQALAFERDAKRHRKQQTADDGKTDEPYDVDLHISKQSTPQCWIKDFGLTMANSNITTNR